MSLTMNDEFWEVRGCEELRGFLYWSMFISYNSYSAIHNVCFIILRIFVLLIVTATATLRIFISR